MKLTSRLFVMSFFIATTTVVFAAPPHNTRVYPNPDLKQVLAELHEVKSEIRELKSLLIKHYQATNQRASQRVSHPASPINRWSCYINTPFNGSFTATGRTKNEALGKTLGKCNHKSSSNLACNEHKVACSTE